MNKFDKYNWQLIGAIGYIFILTIACAITFRVSAISTEQKTKIIAIAATESAKLVKSECDDSMMLFELERAKLVRNNETSEITSKTEKVAERCEVARKKIEVNKALAIKQAKAGFPLSLYKSEFFKF